VVSQGPAKQLEHLGTREHLGDAELSRVVGLQDGKRRGLLLLARIREGWGTRRTRRSPEAAAAVDNARPEATVPPCVWRGLLVSGCGGHRSRRLHRRRGGGWLGHRRGSATPTWRRRSGGGSYGDICTVPQEAPEASARGGAAAAAMLFNHARSGAGVGCQGGSVDICLGGGAELRAELAFDKSVEQDSNAGRWLGCVAEEVPKLDELSLGGAHGRQGVAAQQFGCAGAAFRKRVAQAADEASLHAMDQGGGGWRRGWRKREAIPSCLVATMLPCAKSVVRTEPCLVYSMMGNWRSGRLCN